MSQTKPISGEQTSLLLLQVCWAAPLIYVPPGLIRIAGPDAWLGLLLGSVAGLAVLLLVWALAGAFRGGDLFDWTERAAGRWFAPLLQGIFVLYFWVTTARDLRNVADFYASIPLFETPLWAILVVMATLAAWAARLGPTILCRANAICMVVAFVILLTVPLALTGGMDPGYLRPVLSGGLSPLLQSGFVAAGSFGEVVVFALFLPGGPGHRGVRRASFAGLILGVVAMEVIVLSILLTFGPSLAQALYKPSDTLVTMMAIGQVAERFDMVLISIWQPTVILRIGVSLYASAVGLSRLCQLGDHRGVVLPLAVLSGLLAVWGWGSLMEAWIFNNWTWPGFSVAISLGLPTVLYLLARLRFGRKEGEHATA